MKRKHFAKQVSSGMLAMVMAFTSVPANNVLAMDMITETGDNLNSADEEQETVSDGDTDDTILTDTYEDAGAEEQVLDEEDDANEKNTSAEDEAMPDENEGIAEYFSGDEQIALYAANEGIRLYAVYKQDPTASDFTFEAPSDLTYSGTEKTVSVGYANGNTQKTMGALTVYYKGTTRTTDEPYELSTTAPTKAGTYEVYVVSDGGTHYFPSSDRSSGKIYLGKFTIAPKELSISDPVDTVSDATVIRSHKTYKRISGVNSEVVTMRYTYDYEENNNKSADVDTPNVAGVVWHAVIPDPQVNNNYVLNPEDGGNGHIIYHVEDQDKNNEYEIAPTMTVAETALYGDSFKVTPAVSIGKEYGKLNATKWTVTVKDKEEIKYTDTQTTDDFFTIPGSIPAGTYTVEVNYEKEFSGTEEEPLTVRGSVEQSITIEKRTLTVDSSKIVVDKNYDQSAVVYQNGEQLSRTLSFDATTLKNVVNEDQVSFTAEGTYNSADAGNRTIALTKITLDENSAKNYTIVSEASGSGIINKADATVTNEEYGFIYIDDDEKNHGTTHPSIADIANVKATALKLNEETMQLENVVIDVASSYELNRSLYNPAGLVIDSAGNISSAATETTNQNINKRNELWPTFTVTYTLNENYNKVNSVKIPFAVLGKGEYGITLGLNNDGAVIKDSLWNPTYLKRDGKTLPEVEKEGYRFAGWYSNKELSGEAVTSIPAGSEGKKTFYAKWYKDITNKDVTITAKDVIYNGSAFDVVVKDGETVLEEGKDYSVTYTTQYKEEELSDEHTGAGKVTAVITGLEKVSEHGYRNGYSVSRKVTFTISPKTVTVSDDIVDLSKTYDGKAVADPSGLEVTGNLTVDGKEQGVTLRYAIYAVDEEGNTTGEAISNPKDSGNYAVVATPEISDPRNFVVDPAAGSGIYKKTFTISPKTVTVSGNIADLSKTYDGTAVAAPSGLKVDGNLTVDGKEQGVTLHYAVYAADEGGNITGGAIGNPKDSGRYTVVVTPENSDPRNFVVDPAAGSEVYKKTFTISPKTVTVSGNIADLSKTYDGKAVATPSGLTTTGNLIVDGKEQGVFIQYKIFACDQNGNITGGEISVPKNAGKYMVVAVPVISDQRNFAVTATPGDAIYKKVFNIEEKKEEINSEAISMALNAGLKVSQTGSSIGVKWGKVKGADGYNVYVQYCGSKFNSKSLNQVSGSKNSIAVKKVNGKKLNLKKNYKIYVEAYKNVNGKKTVIGQSIIAHIVGCKNTRYTNVKGIKLQKKSFTLKPGKSATIKGTTIKVNRYRKQLTNAHAKELRYTSSNTAVATVTAGGKIKAVGKGSCTVYVYARNGYAQKVKVTVK